MPPRRTWLTFLVILAINFLIVRMLFPPGEDASTVPYTLFKEQVAARNVEKIYSQGEGITGRFLQPVTYPAERDTLTDTDPAQVLTFETTVPAFVDPGLEALLIASGVEISAEPIKGGGNPIFTLLFGFGPAILLIAFYVWIFRRAKQAGGIGGGMIGGLGKSSARRFDQEEAGRVTFADVAGIDEAENELV